MKKLLMTLAIAAMSLAGFNAAAQQNTNTRRNNTESADKMYRPQRFTDYAFEGILLDIPQQARIDSLNAATEAQIPNFNKRKGECTDSASCTVANCHQDKKVKGDKRGRRDFKDGKESRGNRDGRGYMDKGPRGMNPEQREQYVKKVKEILTPDQYTAFLENLIFQPYFNSVGPVVNPNQQSK